MNSPIVKTTIIRSGTLNSLAGARIVLASETFQVTGSFKFRAAFNLANSVPNTHLITASSGNFGQALACACKLLGKRCTVVMPNNSAKVKIAGVEHYGAEIELIDTKVISREAKLDSLRKSFPAACITNAYDHPLIIEGNASLGRELAEILPLPDIIVVPIGGGGLSAGVVTGLKQTGARIPVVGAEPELANDAARSFRAGKIIANETEPQTIADGARTISLGKHNWKILEKGLEDIIEVSEDRIAEAVRILFQHANLKVEPTGALAVAAVLMHRDWFKDKQVCCIVSGGNVDVERYASILTQ